MLGLYIFWLLILLGGQLTYAVQNADFLTNESAWQKTSERTKEIVSLSVLLLTLKQFNERKEPLRISQLRETLRVPSHILNLSINRLCNLGYIHPIEGDSIEHERDRAYTPARPLDKLTLRQFKEDFECYGNTEGAELLAANSQVIQSYIDEVVSLKGCEKGDWTIGRLLEESK